MSDGEVLRNVALMLLCYGYIIFESHIDAV